MSAEIVVVLMASGLGVLVSLALLVEAIGDLRLAQRNDTRLVGLASREVVAESIRFIVLAIFLVLAILAAAGINVPPGIVTWGLIAVPVLAMASSVYAWFWRRTHFAALRETVEDSGEHPVVPPGPAEAPEPSE